MIFTHTYAHIFTNNSFWKFKNWHLQSILKFIYCWFLHFQCRLTMIDMDFRLFSISFPFDSTWCNNINISSRFKNIIHTVHWIVCLFMSALIILLNIFFDFSSLIQSTRVHMVKFIIYEHCRTSYCIYFIWIVEKKRRIELFP